MTALKLIDELRSRGVSLTVDGPDLVVRGEITDLDCRYLKAFKPRVLELLASNPQTHTPTPRGEALSAELKSAVRQASRLVYGRSVGLTSPEWSAAEAEMDAAVAAGDRPRFEAARKAYLELAQRTAGKSCTP